MLGRPQHHLQVQPDVDRVRLGVGLDSGDEVVEENIPDQVRPVSKDHILQSTGSLLPQGQGCCSLGDKVEKTFGQLVDPALILGRSKEMPGIGHRVHDCCFLDVVYGKDHRYMELLTILQS